MREVLNLLVWHHSHLKSSSLLKPADLIGEGHLPSHPVKKRKGKISFFQERRGSSACSSFSTYTKPEQLEGDILSSFCLPGWHQHKAHSPAPGSASCQTGDQLQSSGRAHQLNLQGWYQGTFILESLCFPASFLSNLPCKYQHLWLFMFSGKWLPRMREIMRKEHKK